MASLAAVVSGVAAAADKRTVCTITVNSPDEKQTMRRYLPERDYRFVELVEHGRADWLETACQRQVQCDVLVVSGHFNGTSFYTTRLDVNDHLPVAEMERASCSASCPGLFSHLKGVYLFGCDSLNPDPGLSAAADLERSLVRAGRAPADAARLSRELGARHAESNRDVMRRIFVDTPVIYGFSGHAPLGPTSAALLNRYFAGGSGDVASGRANRRLLGVFAANAMTVVPGLTSSDPRAAYRAEVCRFVDERQSPTQRLHFIHQVLRRDTAEARMFFERIETFLASLDEGERRDPAFVAALGEIANDGEARDRYLALARDSGQPPIRARMIDVAATLGWLTPDERRGELVRLMADLIARAPMSGADVDLVCALNRDGAFDADRESLARSVASSPPRADRAAALACLGSRDDHARMLEALASGNDADVRIAEIYFYHRPIADGEELRTLTTRIAAMTQADAQVRALETLARQRIDDRDALAALTKLFPRATSIAVQRAIAGVLIRADYRSLASAELVSLFRDHRMRSPDGQDVIDILIRRLQVAS